MAITKQKKEEIVAKVGDIVKKSPTVVFTRFHGLSVSNASEMRQDLREKGVGYTVAKKTLVKRVLDAAGIEGEQPPLEGELALAYGEDAIAPAQGIAAFQKKFEDAVEPLGGIFEGRFISAAEVGALALIPPREVLYGQLVGMLAAPIRQTVGALAGVSRSFVGVLGQIAEKKG